MKSLTLPRVYSFLPASRRIQALVSYFRFPSFPAAALYASVAFSATAQAQILANFNGGNGTTSVDQYTGIAGSGWSTAWNEISAVDITATVENSNPLNGGGNYLRVVNNDTTANDSGGDGVYRSYSNFGGVNLASQHTISFDFRLDSAASEFTSSDGITIVNDPTNPVLGSSNGFGIIGALSGSNVVWQVRNGATSVNTGMLLTTGTVYSFTINLDPANHQYTTSIFNGATTYTSGLLNYRNITAATYPLLLFNSKDLSGSQSVTFSLDKIVIAPVPEPAGLSTFAIGLAALFLARRKRSGRPITAR